MHGAFAAHNGLAGRHGHIGIINGCFAVRAVINVGHAAFVQVRPDGLLQGKTAVVGAQCNGFLHMIQLLVRGRKPARYVFYLLRGQGADCRRAARSRSACERRW